MQRIDILPTAARADSVEFIDAFGEVHVREMTIDAAEALRRWARALRLLERVTEQGLAACGATLARGKSTNAAPRTGRQIREHPIDQMYRKRQISDRAWLAAREIAMVLDHAAMLEGLGSTLKSEGMLSQGGTGEGRQEALMQATQAWARIVAAILADRQCGAEVAHRRNCVQVLEKICHEGLSINDLERMGGFGRRAVLARRLKAGLDVAARAMSIVGNSEGRVRAATFESADAESEAA